MSFDKDYKMNEIEPGTSVIVTIKGRIDQEGIQVGDDPDHTGVWTASGAWAGFPFQDPDVQVIPIDLETGFETKLEDET